MKYYIGLATLLALSGCNSDNVFVLPDLPSKKSIEVNFSDGEQGWKAGFSDFPIGDEEHFEFESGVTTLPGSSDDSKGFHLGSMNRSDDVFMYIKHHLTGLRANTKYIMNGEVSFLTNAGDGCFGIGGAPGESVYIKTGATEIEPAQVDYHMNIDIGHQSQPGNDSIVIGNVVAEGLSCESDTFKSKTISFSKTDGFEFTTDTEGASWIYVGSDSAYEGRTDLYYTNIKVAFTPD